MKLTYLSHSCFLIKTGDHTLLIDPFLSGNPKAQMSADDVSCDYILITHGHADHVGDAAAIAKRTGATIISTYEVALHCGNQDVDVHPMHIGGGHDFDFGRVKLTIAHHGSGIETEDGLRELGNPAGLIITADDTTIYHAGDTGLFMDMQLIGEIDDLDVALLPIGDNFTMGIDDAVRAVGFLKPALAIPMHYGTFDLIDVDPAMFVDGVTAAGGKAQVLAIGDSIDL